MSLNGAEDIIVPSDVKYVLSGNPLQLNLLNGIQAEKITCNSTKSFHSISTNVVIV